MRPLLLCLCAWLILLPIAPGARANGADAVAQGQQALARGDVEAARERWESAAIGNEQAVYALLVRLYEDGTEKDLAEAYKWAWIGLARTWDPAFQAGANADYDRLQNTALRYQRQEGRERADRWLDAHPVPAAQP